MDSYFVQTFLIIIIHNRISLHTFRSYDTIFGTLCLVSFHTVFGVFYIDFNEYTHSKTAFF